MTHMRDPITGVGDGWTLAATAEAMMSPYCTTGGTGVGCTGHPPDSKTASAPCGTCWELTTPDKSGNEISINVYVADACPCGNKDKCPTQREPDDGGTDNSEWCRAEIGSMNDHNKYNHFDIWEGDTLFNLGDSGEATFKNIICPDKLKQLMKENCCGVNWDDQGCPHICGEFVDETLYKDNPNYYLPMKWKACP
jgi:hypothetical protein